MKRRRDSQGFSKNRPPKRRVTAQRYPVAGRQITVVPRVYGNARAVTERKYFETERSLLGLSNVTTAWTGTELDPATTLSFFSPIQGNDIINRIGRKCQILAWKVRGFINTIPVEGATTGHAAALARLIFFIDNQTNAAQAQGEEVITSNQAQGTPAEPGICMYQNKNNFGRFRILKDKMFRIQDPNLGSTGANYDSNGLIIPFKCNFKFKRPITVHFNQTNGGTIADIINSSLHLIGGQNTVDLQSSVSYKSRVTFIDM